MVLVQLVIITLEDTGGIFDGTGKLHINCVLSSVNVDIAKV